MRDVLRVITIGGVLVIPFITLIVIDGLFFPYITGKNFIFRIVVEIVFAAWILLALYDRTYRPRFSYISVGLVSLVVILFFANLLGAHPETSWWSNFERMEGYVTIVHLFLYFLVAGSVLNTQKLWRWFWHLSIVAATFVAVGALSEYFDPEVTRVAGVLGNAAYLAIYMLFHIFLVMYLFVRNPRIELRILYVLLGILFVFILLQTSTRGTAIGMATGLVATVSYIAIFARTNPQFRKLAFGSCAVLVILAGGFWAVKDQEFVQTSPTLSRIANIDLQEDLEVRLALWNVAWQGVKERPILGWGQGNFTYVFDKHYDPFLYDQEQWFDRTHNLVFDWLIAGGILALLAYLSILLTTGYYLLRRQEHLDADNRFSVLEQAVLFGLVVGYFTHNLVVFDNIVSYIFFFSVLAMIHARVSRPVPSVQTLSVTSQTIRTAVLPAVVLVCGFSMYVITVPNWTASASIIHASQNFEIGKAKLANNDSSAQDNFRQALEYFEKAIEQDSFAEQEITEQLTQKYMEMLSISPVNTSIKQNYAELAEQQLEKLAEHKPGFARVHIFRGVFYRAIGEHNKAREAYVEARSIAPRKPDVVFDQGVTELVIGDIERAKDYFAETLALDERNLKARSMYVTTLFLADEAETAEDLLREGERPALRHFVNDPYAMQAANANASPELLIDLYKIKTATGGANKQEWINLAVLQYEADRTKQAISTLEKAKTKHIDDVELFTCLISNLKEGVEPGLNCGEFE